MLRDFRSRILIRVLMLAIALMLMVLMFMRQQMVFAGSLMVLVVALQVAELFRFTTQTNRKLTRFLESIRYQDFVSGFTSDHQLGHSFKDLNIAFNGVLEAFRKARSEKEEHWQYLNTVVQQVRTGILSFDEEGQVQLVNTNAKRYLGVNSLGHMEELAQVNPDMLRAIRAVVPGSSTLYKGRNFQLTIQATEMRIRGNQVKLVTLQNIQSELQQQELEAWQNLTRVLRHEIMNSITPISSLTSTLREILDHDMKVQDDHYTLESEGAEDLREGLSTIENRSKGLIKFIDAYREYTSLPQPRFRSVALKGLLENVVSLMMPELRKTPIHFEWSCDPDYLTVQADEEMIQQVLINLIKNAVESLHQQPNGRIQLTARFADSRIVIEVSDNGPGIIQEALDRIFIPFFTTKKTGSGIGLSLSRQIMQMHHGSLTATSVPHELTLFRLTF
ncbi:MAG: ATP-binding protein [Cyclobacteriaceae bacterium]